MDIEIRHEPYTVSLYGWTEMHETGPYGPTVMRAIGVLWEEIGSKGLSNKGITTVVYGADGSVFAGVELTGPASDTKLVPRTVVLENYAYYKHIGPYTLLADANVRMKASLAAQGIAYSAPSLEVYGHMGPDESKLETEIYYTIAS